MLSKLLLVGLAAVALAHGDEATEAMDMDSGEQQKPGPNSYPPTYFALRDHAGVMYAHIAIMVISWVFVLPTGKI